MVNLRVVRVPYHVRDRAEHALQLLHSNKADLVLFQGAGRTPKWYFYLLLNKKALTKLGSIDLYCQNLAVLLGGIQGKPEVEYIKPMPGCLPNSFGATHTIGIKVRSKYYAAQIYNKIIESLL